MTDFIQRISAEMSPAVRLANVALARAIYEQLSNPGDVSARMVIIKACLGKHADISALDPRKSVEEIKAELMKHLSSDDDFFSYVIPASVLASAHN